MLLILPTLLVLLATAVHIPAEETRAFGTYNTDRREPESVGEDLSYVEKLLVAERVNTQDTRPPQQDEDEGAFVSGQSDPQPEILHAGIEPTSVGAVDHESSEDRLQRTRQTAQPKLNRAHPESPCPSVFSYEGTRAGKERWYGVVLVTTDAPLTGVRLIIQLNKKAQILGNWLGEVCTKDNIEFRIWNSRKKIQPGPPVSVKFFVKYSDKEVDPPRIRSISLNGKQICKSSGRPVTRPPVSRPITPSTTTTRRTTPRPNTITTTSRPHTSQHGQNGIVDGVQCGRVEVQPAPFITHGQHSARGQWPWHAALYQNKGTDLSYICGGSLIGKRNVLTAAHCVTRTYNSRPVDPSTLLVYLGKYHLNLWSTGGVQDKLVDVIKVHPQYNSTSFYADIAIIVLASDAEFTLYVKPVCLWDRNQIALKTVEGVEGTVVGWGYDERGSVTEELMMAKMPVVSVQTCLWSYPEFFPRFTSDKTYCAGFRNGTSVCNGDSGGGMVFPKKEKPDSPETWYLRGLVSLGASMEEKRVCNTKHYVVFTDVAKYLDWIQQTILSVNN